MVRSLVCLFSSFINTHEIGWLSVKLTDAYIVYPLITFSETERQRT